MTRKGHVLLTAVYLVASIACSGCAVVHLTTHSQSKLLKLKLGMSQEDVRAYMGEPSSMGGWHEDGTEILVDRYLLYPATDKWRAAVLGPVSLGLTWCIVLPQWGYRYDFYYSDGCLEKWGYPAPDEIKELRIR